MKAKDLEKLCDYLECNDASLEAQQEAAAELRRLHEVNQELLEALKAIVDSPDEDSDVKAYENALKAINKATGEQT